MSANSVRGKGRLTVRSVIEWLLYAIDMGMFWGWAGLRALLVGGAAGLITFFLIGETTAWIVAIACEPVFAVIFAGWSVLTTDDSVPTLSSLSLGWDGLREDVMVEIWHGGVSINDSPINAWIVERVVRRRGDRVDLIVSSKDRRTTLTIWTKKEDIVAHFERLAASSGRLA